MKLRLGNIASKFLPKYSIQSTVPLGNGLINETFLVTATNGSETKKLVLQRVNGHVYPYPEKVIENHTSLWSITNKNEQSIISTPLQTNEGNFFYTENGAYWRAQTFLENAICFDEVSDTHMAFEGAKIVGKFNILYSKFENLRLNDTIDGFHNLNHYLGLYEKALHSKHIDRLDHCIAEVQFINSNKSSMLEAFNKVQNLPDRVCHYDTKINNILFDQVTQKAVRIIDLDNMMFGKVIFDFGDMMRSFISPVDENEKDLTKVKIRWEILEAMVKGYLSEAQKMLSKKEISMLVTGGILITYEQSVRFLSDYLMGDQYYKTKYPEHNLIRAKNQIHLTKLYLENRAKLEQYIDDHSR